MKSILCPKCHNRMEIPEHYLGKSVKCINCGNDYVAAESVTPKATKPKKPRADKASNSAPLKIGIIAGIIVLALLAAFFMLKPSSPEDAFAKELRDIAVESEAEGFVHSFELVDYDIVLSDSLVYTHECTMRFIARSKTIESSLSASSEYHSHFKYNDPIGAWELHGLERVETEFDFSGNEKLSQDYGKAASLLSTKAEELASKLKSLVDKRRAIALEGIHLISEQSDAIAKGGVNSAAYNERQRTIHEKQAEIESLDVQIAEIEKKCEAFIAKISPTAAELTEELNSLKELILQSNLEHLLESSLSDFMPSDKSEFKTRYHIDVDKGVLERI